MKFFLFPPMYRRVCKKRLDISIPTKYKSEPLYVDADKVKLPYNGLVFFINFKKEDLWLLPAD